jgi:hypothetical protein
MFSRQIIRMDAIYQFCLENQIWTDNYVTHHIGIRFATNHITTQ